MPDASRNALREHATGPGGFDDLDGAEPGRTRQQAWLQLLDLPQPTEEADSPADEGGTKGSHLRPHKDEHQVRLDVQRSFSWPHLTRSERVQRQAQLHEVIVCVLRRFPVLEYYQGYHDVVSVFVVTFARHAPPPEVPDARIVSVVLPPQSGSPGMAMASTQPGAPTHPGCIMEPGILWGGHPARWANPKEPGLLKRICSRVSLHVLRDHHARTLKRTLAQLQLLGQAMCVQPFSLSSLDHFHQPNGSVENNEGTEEESFSGEMGVNPNTLPLFALSWITTCFAHDVTHLSLAQRFMDAILAYGPRFGIWIAVAMTLQRTKELGASDQVSKDFEVELYHQHLKQLPHFVADPVIASIPPPPPPPPLPRPDPDPCSAPGPTPPSVLSASHSLPPAPRFKSGRPIEVPDRTPKDYLKSSHHASSPTFQKTSGALDSPFQPSSHRPSSSDSDRRVSSPLLSWPDLSPSGSLYVKASPRPAKDRLSRSKLEVDSTVPCSPSPPSHHHPVSRSPSLSSQSSPRRKRFSTQLGHSLASKPSSLALIGWGEPEEAFSDPDVSLAHESWFDHTFSTRLAPSTPATPPKPAHRRRNSLPAPDLDLSPSSRSRVPSTERQKRDARALHERRPSEASSSKGAPPNKSVLHPLPLPSSSHSTPLPLSSILRFSRTLQECYEPECEVERVVNPDSVLVTWDRTLGPGERDRGKDACNAHSPFPTTNGFILPFSVGTIQTPNEWSELDAQAVAILQLGSDPSAGSSPPPLSPVSSPSADIAPSVRAGPSSDSEDTMLFPGPHLASSCIRDDKMTQPEEDGVATAAAVTTMTMCPSLPSSALPVTTNGDGLVRLPHRFDRHKGLLTITFCAVFIALLAMLLPCGGGPLQKT